ncbi:MAG: AraC family transcriptional regulator [Clostridia bacterium]|nr:AraC family transcriptional regulator [Clostridia bacterium]
MNEIRTIIDDVTLEETAASVEAAFPYRADRDILDPMAGGCFPWHWHGDVELFTVESGALRYSLPGTTRDFHAGDVGFVNANVLHMTRCLGGQRCVLQEHIFLPRLVGGTSGSAIDLKYVQPLLMNRRAELLSIPADAPGAEEMRRLMRDAIDAFGARTPGFEVAVRNAMSTLWLQLLALAPEGGAGRGSADEVRLKAMLRFIDENHAEPLTLDDIAAAASVGPREASRCFRRQLNLSPFEYLIGCRVDRAAERLRATDQSVTDIALGCGFGSVSYFGKLFRERLGMTPSEYRRARGG